MRKKSCSFGFFYEFRQEFTFLENQNNISESSYFPESVLLENFQEFRFFREPGARFSKNPVNYQAREYMFSSPVS